MTYLFLAGVIFTAVVLITDPALVKVSFFQSYELLTDVLIPSVFPFMILSHIIAVSKIKYIISYPVKIIFKIIRLPMELAPLFLCSSAGGYLSGIGAAAAQVKSNQLTTKEAYMLLPFLINAGPGFVILAVGRGMYGSVKAGIVLYFSQLISSIIVGRMLYKKGEEALSTSSYMTFEEALITSVKESSEAMLYMCGFVCFFGLVNSIVSSYFGGNIIALLLASILEVTNGCKIFSESKLPIWVTSFLISFSGLSILFQIKSVCRKYGIRCEHLAVIKLFEGILAAFLTSLYVKLYPFTCKINALQSPPLSFYNSNRILEVILIGMMFLQSFAKTDYSRH